MNKHLVVFLCRYETNDVDASIPEVWAAETLRILEEELVVYPLVNNDYNNQVASYGDTVNISKPAQFTARRKAVTSDVTTQNATLTNTQAVLNQQLHVSFLLRDRQMSLSFQDLVAMFLDRAVRSMAHQIDTSILAQRYQFISNGVGKLGTALARTSLIANNKKADDLLWPNDDRVVVVTPGAAADILDNDNISHADSLGDNSAVRRASLGQLWNMHYVKSTNNKTIAYTGGTTAGAINAGNLIVGSTSLTVDGFTGYLDPGTWCTIAGDMTPQKITDTTDTSGVTVGITIAPGLKSAVLDDAVVTVYDKGQVNLAAGYASGWEEDMVIDTFTAAPAVGQLISSGTASTGPIYAQMNGGSATLLRTDRPTDAILADDALLGIGPVGDFSFAFHRDVLTFVSRPLAKDPDANMAVLDHNGLALRVELSRDSVGQGKRVTVDLLYGIKVLDTNLGFLLYS